MFKHFKAQSVAQRLLVSMLLVALIPVTLLTVHLYHAAWENSWREIREKHQLIAENLASPVAIFINDHRNMLALFADNLKHHFPTDPGTSLTVSNRLHDTLGKVDGFKSLTLLDQKGNILALSHKSLDDISVARLMVKAFASDRYYLETLKTGHWQFSGIERSPLDAEPTLLMTYPVMNEKQQLQGVLIAELQVEVIEKLRRNVKFGIKGHSAIVDQHGHVIAHPNPVWMQEMRDISHLPVVKLMMDGKTGVTTFYSPFIKQNMVAGYTSVPLYGWGIMVPQPEGEVVAQVRGLMISNLVWGFAGVLLAIVLAIFLSRWINNPINRLAQEGHELLKNNLMGDMSDAHAHDPLEVRQLNRVVRTLVSQLQHSRKEVHELNNNLQVRIDEATQQLRDSNEQLEMFAKSDYLTSLANRRYFEQELRNIAGRRSGDTDPLCIILLDIDNFKNINDHYGHAAGDEILTGIAEILETTMRSCDLIARYAGDEFVLALHCEEKVALDKAERLRSNIEKMRIDWQDQQIHTTVSIGVYCIKDNKTLDVARVMQLVDAAMYEAKKQGRNRVVSAC